MKGEKLNKSSLDSKTSNEKTKLEHRIKCLLPTVGGDFQLHLFAEDKGGDDKEEKEHLALVMGDVRGKVNVLLRIHSECCTGDVFGCQRCDCQDQLNGALDMIRRKSEGVLLYLRQEGRGIGLENKLKAYRLQDEGLDTVEANLALGFEADLREYDIAAEMIEYLGIKSVSLISNNLNKVKGIEECGVQVAKRVPIVINSPVRDRINLFKTKQKKLGHEFDALDSIPIVEEIDEDYILSSPEIFLRDALIPQATKENTELISKELQEKFGDNLQCLLLQGSNMRGDGSIQESDFDYICFLKKVAPDVISKFSQIKKQFPRSNFLYLSAEEYRLYSRDSRLQFFITRKVFGDQDLGHPPSRKEILDTAIKYAIQLKDVVRPLLFEFIADPENKSLLNQAHTVLKRIDDCFMRVVFMYLTGKYPLHREHLREEAQGESVDTITHLIDNWYTGDFTVRDVSEALGTADRLISIFLRKVIMNRL